MPLFRLIVSALLAVGLVPATNIGADETTPPADIQFRGPHIVPSGASVPEFTFEALNNDGSLRDDYSATVTVSGLLVQTDDPEFSGTFQPHTAQVAFEGGTLSINATALKVRQVSASGTGLTITSDQQQWQFPISTRPAWVRLLPPILAIGLAILFQDVLVALVLAIFAGCALYFPATQVYQAVPDFCQTMVQQVADTDHASVILFTVLLGAMIQLMTDSGGTGATIDHLTTFARTRQKGMVLTWVMGLLIFFDDYANTMLIGGAMRPLCDRLRIARAKLAFLIDATAAPIAGLAISTWTAFEIDQVATGFTAAGIEADAGEFFWSTIPFRFYPILMIIVVGAVAFSGRDLGAMLRAELRQTESPVVDQKSIPNGSMWLAILPVCCLVCMTITGFFRGTDAYALLLISSFAASSLAFVLARLSGALTLEECSRSWVAGISSMMTPVSILVLAWGVSAVCRTDQLNTAEYIIGIIGNSVPAPFLPSIAFLTAGAIAVAIGSSFTTMALLVPMLLPLAWNLLGSDASLQNPVFTATIGAILAGAIFGDHCSPISDTTVLSSAAAGCEHLHHVSTQLPYALLTAVASLLLGYLPIGFGIPWWICLPVAMVVCVGGIMVLGRKTDQTKTT